MSNKQGWRDGSEVKSTDCSSRGPEFNSQQPHGDSQPSIMRSGTLFLHASIHGRNVVYIINKSFFKKRGKAYNKKKKRKKESEFSVLKQNHV